MGEWRYRSTHSVVKNNTYKTENLSEIFYVHAARPEFLHKKSLHDERMSIQILKYSRHNFLGPHPY
jgi:hypothetical protein